ncbi:secreted RxLR effector protein 161-like [Vicia villosa]|uniref:secreted RxLR effector protein 161-like n=1 Tax=Vicia villosa TaxID=3911 RepID=UPI00273AD247|nr:secreted RxLR effector protein 161-like [Vicia villosa]
MEEFEMSDTGRMHYFFSLEDMQLDNGIFISQKRYTKKILKIFGMEKNNLVLNLNVPRVKIGNNDTSVTVISSMFNQLVGILIYLTITMLDLMYVVNVVKRHMAKPTETHCMATKRILRYVQGTMCFRIFYQRLGNQELVGYIDSDNARCIDDRKSTSGYAFILSNAVVAWSSRKHPIVTLNITEAEFIDASTCAGQLIWMKRVLSKLNYNGR